MSEVFLNHEAIVEINDQQINIKTTIKKEFKDIMYQLTSKNEMAPITIALALYIMCDDICKKLNLNIEDLSESLGDEITGTIN